MTTTHDELALLIERNQVDGVTLREAAKRLRRIDLDQLLFATQIVEAVHGCPLIDRDTAKTVEKLVLAAAMGGQRSTMRIGSIASSIMDGEEYTHNDVLSLASLVLSKSNNFE